MFDGVDAILQVKLEKTKSYKTVLFNRSLDGIN